MTTNRDELKAQVRALRSELRIAERALGDSYGEPVKALASALLQMFDVGELRRWSRVALPSRLHEDLPGPTAPPMDVASAVACLLSDAEVSASTLRTRLLAERPRRENFIDAALAGWEFP